MNTTQRITLAAALWLAMGVAGCAPTGSQGGNLDEAQQAELATLAGQIGDLQRAARTRQEAAMLLLNRDSAEAVDMLVRFLGDTSNPSAQIAVARAIAVRGGRQGEFVDPLAAMLTGRDPAVRTAAAKALGSYRDPAVVEKLISIASDSKRDQDIRLTAIDSLAHMLDKQAVEAMVNLLDDKDEPIRLAAAEALGTMTNIQAFGQDTSEWKRWWRQSRDRDQSLWMGDLARSLGEAKGTLQAENARLRDRLTRAMVELYAATPPAQRETLLAGFLGDPLGDVRLAGVTLAQRRLAANEPISPELRQQVRGLLADGDPRLRRASAMLLASLGDVDSLDALLGRLGNENDPAARQGLLIAVGQLRDAKALPAVLADIPSRDDGIAAAAAEALARIAENHPLAGPQRTQAAEILVARYELAAESPNGLPLREALLTAMGVVGDGEFLQVMQGAVKDRAATVRLAAVNALARLGDARAAAVLDPLASDADRGVRQAAIAALGTLGGQMHLATILARTDPAMETDSAVRQKAWDVTMAVLKNAGADTLRKVAEELAGRSDARDRRIEVLGLLEAASAGNDVGRAEALRLLGLALLEADRPAEAEPHLAQAVEIYRELDAPEARKTWSEWIVALLASDDVAVITAMGDQEDEKAFAQAMDQMTARLAELKGQHRYSALIALGRAALDELPHRLSEQRQSQLEQIVAEAIVARNKQDRRQVTELVAQLGSTDQSVSAAAAEQLQAMGASAVQPLLAELRKTVTDPSPNPQAERAILAVLAKLAPDLNGYNPDAPIAEKTDLIDRWRASL